MAVWARFCKMAGRVQGGMQFGMLAQVVFWDAVWGVVSGAGDGAVFSRG